MATMQEVSLELSKELNIIQTQSEKISLSVAQDVLTQHRIRIFSKGETLNGSTFTLKESSIKSKRKRGTFSTTRVTFVDTNQLNTDYNVGISGKDAALGLVLNTRREGGTNREVVDSLENRFGTIFGINETESKLIDEALEEAIDRIIK